MAVAGYELAVEAYLARHSRRHDLELCAKKVFLVDGVSLLEVCDKALLVGLRASVAFRALLGLCQRAPAHWVEVLRREEFAYGLFLLVLAEVGKDVGYHEDGVAGVVADRDLHLGAVLPDYSSIEGERKRKPLVFLYAPVYVAVEIDDAALLVDRARLQVEARRIRVAAYDLEPDFRDWLAADHGRHHRPVLAAAEDLVSGLEGLERAKLLEALCLQKPYAFRIAAPLRLCDAEISHVFAAVFIHRQIFVRLH